MIDEPRSAAADGVHEVARRGIPGGGVLPLNIVAAVVAAVLLGFAVRASVHGGGGARSGLWAAAVVLAAVAATGLRGLTRLAPGEAVVLQLLGRYVGTLRTPGMRWVDPWATRRRVSTRLRTHETATLKVNDTDGIPVELAMVVTWWVSDPARALFGAENFEQFLRSQCEMALRHVAAGHRYEPAGVGAPALSTSAGEVAIELTKEVRQRVEPAGIAVIDSELVRVAYAPEIAHAMLRRQQAAAIVAARQLVVEGAVGMVELALERLDREHVVDLDEERRATMVSNLLVVLCSDHGVQPMVNAGSLYL